jgi:hypothetical protein
MKTQQTYEGMVIARIEAEDEMGYWPALVPASHAVAMDYEILATGAEVAPFLEACGEL